MSDQSFQSFSFALVIDVRCPCIKFSFRRIAIFNPSSTQCESIITFINQKLHMRAVFRPI